MKSQFISRLPIPDAPTAERAAIADLALAITERARTRYALHCQARSRLLTGLGPPGATLNKQLTAWWTLDFPALRAEITKVFRRDIPGHERDAWEVWLKQGTAEHSRLTVEIIDLETRLNDHVYGLFTLRRADIALIEEATKYPYGEV